MINNKFKRQFISGDGRIKSGRILLVASTTLVIFYFLIQVISLFDGQISRITEIIPVNCFLLVLIISLNLFPLFHIKQYRGIVSVYPGIKVDTFSSQFYQASSRSINLLSCHSLSQKYFLTIILTAERLKVFSIVYCIRNSLAPMPETNNLGNWNLNSLPQIGIHFYYNHSTTLVTYDIQV